MEKKENVESIENTESLNNTNIEDNNINTIQSEVQNENQINNDINKVDKKKNNKKIIILILTILIIVGTLVCILLVMNKNNKEKIKEQNIEYVSDYKMNGNSLEDFDLYFLQLENKEVNKIYSPISIKYALKMLEEGTDGNSKSQISAITGDYQARKYTNSENMSFANALFIKDTFKEYVKQDYINKLKNTYDVEIIFDPFTNSNNINKWVKNKTLNLLDNLVDDVSNTNFALINALAIDMDWEEKFLYNERTGTRYSHERKKGQEYTYGWYPPDRLKSSNFKDVNEEISGMDIIASLNNYDIIKELGEDNIRKTVEDAYRKYMIEYPDEYNYSDLYDNTKYKDLTEEQKDELISNYLDSYIKEIGSNYKKNNANTDFSLYVDDNVKIFAKDLKEYNGTTLQYVGIMPTTMYLNTYIANLDSKKLNELLSNLKELKPENFTDGVVTEIKGYIPKFIFEYTLNLKQDLEKLGVTDVFDINKSNLNNLISKKGIYIEQVMHKANIEFTQDGIKAAAATMMGGAGAGGSFDYIYEVPFEEIDLTFDKPYMFIIRDKSTGEVWFTGTVYEPLLWEDDSTKTEY